MTLNISEKAYEYAAGLAALTSQSVEQVVEKAVQDKFNDEAEVLQKSVEACSDNEVLALAQLKISPEQNERISVLLKKNSSGSLTTKEQRELIEATHFGRITDLRKAVGIVEAKKRNLIESMDDLP